MSGATRNESSTFEPQLHAINNNYFDYMFCKAGCVISQELPNMALPVYVEFEANRYSNIFGMRAALVDSYVNHPQTDEYTYSVFNITDEYLGNITNGAFSIHGHSNDAVLMMQRVTVSECLGNALTSVIDLSQGHLFLCKDCEMSGERNLDSPQWADYANEFMWRYRDYKLLNRSHFRQYLPLDQSNEFFSGSSH